MSTELVDTIRSLERAMAPTGAQAKRVRRRAVRYANRPIPHTVPSRSAR